MRFLNMIFYTLFCRVSVGMSLIALYATSCAVATFIEKFYSTTAARVWVYNATWFEILHLWLVLCLVGSFLTSKAWERKKYAALLLHFSFILIVIGAGITRYGGFEGTMSIKEGRSADFITTQTHYILIQARSPKNEISYLTIPSYIDNTVNKHIKGFYTFFGEKLYFESGDVEPNEIKDTAFTINAKVAFKGKQKDVRLECDDDADWLIKSNVVLFESDGYEFHIAWGNDVLKLPFSIKLKKFELERYAGSNSPSSYASEVQVLQTDKEPYDYRIYMNHVLDYEGYRFFQSSYFPDETGTILSVNRDPGKNPTYLGYGLLIISIIWLLFAKNGRFRRLGQFLQKQKFFILPFCLMFAYMPLYAFAEMQESTEKTINDADNRIYPKQDILTIIESLKTSTPLSEKLDYILLQDFGGRLKPLHTLANDYIRKITQKNTFKGLNNTQIFLGMTYYPEEWKKVEMIATKTPQLRQILGIPENQKYIALVDVINDNGDFLLFNYVENANMKPPASRNAFEKDLLQVSERISAALVIYSGMALRIFPTDNDVWLNPYDAFRNALENRDRKALEIGGINIQFDDGMKQGIEEHSWDEAIKAVDRISAFQMKNGGDLLPPASKVKSEIFLNKYNPFHILTYPYIIISIVFFIIVLVNIIQSRHTNIIVRNIFYGLLCTLFILHTLALITRWYVSGHAPWSNAYESMLYISWAAICAGSVCFRRSNLALCASSFMAGITLFVAHLGFMDPQIGNLVPVLKSYWLNIHVSVITASYGFLGLCFFLGIITLFMFVLRLPQFKHIDSSIITLSALNEMSMLLGLFLLTIGNFLGGIWANESWGRYWGWDSKETWALISIGVYAIIVHLRLIVRHNLPYIFASASVIGFFSILMTYFGVNYYLSGMHSYAAGDAMSIPFYIKLVVVALMGLIILAGVRRHLEMPHLS